MINLRAILPLAATAAFFILVLAVYHLWSVNGRLESDNDALKGELKTAKGTIDEMNVRQRQVAESDKRLTEELVNAKNTIVQLERDVANGNRRLQLNAKCPSQSSASSGLADGNSAGLTDSAQRDYFTLRKRIETSGKMIRGLQEYIKTQCLN